MNNFDQQTWNCICMDIAIEGNISKFKMKEQLDIFNPPTIERALLGTGVREIIYAAPGDRFWGIRYTKVKDEL